MYKLILKNGKSVTYRYFGSYLKRLVKEYGVCEALDMVKEWL